MKHPIRTMTLAGAAILVLVVLVGDVAFGQLAPAPAVPAGEILRTRQPPAFTTEKTPVFQTSMRTQSSARPPDWGRVVFQFETQPDWLDELEFTFYVYVKDQSARGAEVMLRGVVTYLNVAKGRHQADIFMHPSTLSRMGRPEQFAVVIRHRGAVVASGSTATTPNWWERFPPVDGVLLTRAQTPFALIEYDAYNLIKPAAAAR